MEGWDCAGRVPVPSRPSFPGEFLSTAGSSCSGRGHALSSLNWELPQWKFTGCVRCARASRAPAAAALSAPGRGTRTSIYFRFLSLYPSCVTRPSRFRRSPGALIIQVTPGGKKRKVSLCTVWGTSCPTAGHRGDPVAASCPAHLRGMLGTQTPCLGFFPAHLFARGSFAGGNSLE